MPDSFPRTQGIKARFLKAACSPVFSTLLSSSAQYPPFWKHHPTPLGLAASPPLGPPGSRGAVSLLQASVPPCSYKLEQPQVLSLRFLMELRGESPSALVSKKCERPAVRAKLSKDQQTQQAPDFRCWLLHKVTPIPLTPGKCCTCLSLPRTSVGFASWLLQSG